MWVFSEALFDYLKTRSLTKKLVDFFLVATLFTWIAVVYMVSMNYSEISGMVLRKKPDVKELVRLDKTINDMLQLTMQQMSSDRAAIARFHNSISDVQGRHFVYESRSNEVVQPGVAMESHLRQNLLLSMMNAWAQEFVKDRCVFVTDLKFNDQFFELYRQVGVKSDIKCPIHATDGTLIGFVIVEWTTRNVSLNELKSKETMARDAAARIGAVLSLRPDQP